MKHLFSLFFSAILPVSALAQSGSTAEPVTYIGGEICNPRLHEGGFRYAIGTENIQVMRANRSHPVISDDYGWTYNHAPNMTYWNGRSEEHTSELQSRQYLVCRLLLEKKKKIKTSTPH